MIIKLFRNLLSLFFPEVCLGCKRLLYENESVICTSCRHELPQTYFHLNPENEGYQKFYGRILVEFVGCFLYYHKKGIVQELIHSLKYRGHQEIGLLLGNWYSVYLKEVEKLKDVAIVIPVPLHKKRLRKRGYNQVSTFALTIARELGVDYDEQILVRKIHSGTQSKKNLLDRISGAASVFDVEFDATMHGKHFLIVDDVLTTGATLENCSRAILEIPGARVSIVTMAISHS